MRYFILFIAIGIIGTAAAQNRNSQHAERVAAREQRNARYAQSMNDAVLSHNFWFTPDTFELSPAGMTHSINNADIRMEFYDDYIDINLPYFFGEMPPYRVGMLNYTVVTPENYTARSDGESWSITFDTDLYDANTYSFRLEIHSVSGSATLEIDDNQGKTVSYTGEITTGN